MNEKNKVAVFSERELATELVITCFTLKDATGLENDDDDGRGMQIK